MSIGRANFDDISEADLDDLIQSSVPEGLTVEYKRDPYGNSDAEKKEALKDITSFANSAGGHLIIGMEETNGVPTGLTGLPDADSDALINRLESLVRDGVEPRIVGARMRAVSLRGGGAALVIRIPRSWNPPHRVRTGGINRFYVRNSGGAHEASVEELRVLFTLAAGATQRIKTFRADRIATIVAGRGPVPLPANGRLFVHLVPLSESPDFNNSWSISGNLLYLVAPAKSPNPNNLPLFQARLVSPHFSRAIAGASLVQAKTGSGTLPLEQAVLCGGWTKRGRPPRRAGSDRTCEKCGLDAA